MGWTVTGLLLTLDAVPPAEPAAAELRDIFKGLMEAVLLAQDGSGAWWQVMDFPRRDGNFLESSATGLFASAIAKGVRLGYLDEAKYLAAARKALGLLRDHAVVHLGDGTLGYNLTVDVCGINSATTYEVSISHDFDSETGCLKGC